MNRQNIKKMILCLMTVILFVTTCAPAFASTGDRTLIHYSSEEQADQKYVQGVYDLGDKFCIHVQTGMNGEAVLLYTDPNEEPETYVLKEEMDYNSGEEENTDIPEGENAETGADISEGEGVISTEGFIASEGIPADEGIAAEEGTSTDESSLFGEDHAEDYLNSVYEYITGLFGWKNELYAVVQKTQFDGMEQKESFGLKHIKLENGKAIQEECDLPEPDLSGILEQEDGMMYFGGFSNPFTVGDYLVGTVYGATGDMLMAVDLNTGFCTEYAIEEFNEVAPGRDGTVLLSRRQYDPDTFMSTGVVSALNLEDQSEEIVFTLEGSDVYRMNLCYDQETDTLYYVYAGELWAAPQMDPEQAVAVNECPEAGSGAICLKNGFLVLWNYNVVLLRNTDPAQRGTITLRIKDNTYGYSLSEAVYEMNDLRGDVSVILQSDWAMKTDILQAMMNRDAHEDIYTLSFDSNDFNALLNRGFLPDLSANEKIAADTDRMYPFLQEAVKKDGKIIGVPIYVNSESLGINLRLWKKLGGTEEELPKTWDQFFDWLEKVPEKLSEDVKLLEDDGWMNREQFCWQILYDILTQYQLTMDSKGNNDYLFNTPQINSLLKRLIHLDYDALGIRESEETEDYSGGRIIEWGENDPLLQLNYSGAPGNYYSSIYSPMPLSFEEGQEPVIPVNVNVAFMNPYSEHPEEAMLYLSLVLKNMSLEDQYQVFTDKTEPIPYSYYEQNKKYYEDEIESIKKSLETAEGEEKAMWEESLRMIEENKEQMEMYSWRISQGSVDNYLKINPMMKVLEHYFQNEIFDSDEEGLSDIEGLESEADVDKLLNVIDSKTQMYRMEGH